MDMTKKKTIKGPPPHNVKVAASVKKAKREPATENDLLLGLRLIKLRWDGLDDHDRASGAGSTFGVYFTARQLEALEGYFHQRVKETRK